MKTLPPKHLLIALCLLVGLTAASAAVWFWRQAARPGQIHFERGLDFAAAKQMPQAEKEWMAGVQDDPNFSDNHVQLGDLYAAEGRFAEAAAQYEAALRLMPQDLTLFQRLERAEDAEGDKMAALEAAGNGAALRPEDAKAVGDYGVRAAMLNQPKRALPALKHAHALDPDNADYLLYLARVELQLQDLAGAERDLDSFLVHHPDNAEACYLIASVLHQKPQTSGTAQESLKYAQRAQASAPKNSDANVLLGQVLLDTKQPAQALPAFHQAQTLTPNSVPALRGLLTCYLQLGQPGPAKQTQTALKAAVNRMVQMGHASDLLLANPANTSAALDMARLYEKNGELGPAESYYRRALRHAPQDPHARAALADFLHRTQNPREIPSTP